MAVRIYLKAILDNPFFCEGCPCLWLGEGKCDLYKEKLSFSVNRYWRLDQCVDECPIELGVSKRKEKKDGS